MAVQARVSPGPCLRMMTVLLPNRLEDHLDKECAADQRHHDEQRTNDDKEPPNDLRHHRFDVEFRPRFLHESVVRPE